MILLFRIVYLFVKIPPLAPLPPDAGDLSTHPHSRIQLGTDVGIDFENGDQKGQLGARAFDQQHLRMKNDELNDDFEIHMIMTTYLRLPFNNTFIFITIVYKQKKTKIHWLCHYI